MDQLIYHISIFQFPLSNADGEPKGGTETGLSLEQADHLPPVKQRERSNPVRLSDPESCNARPEIPEERGEQDVKTASLLVISLFVVSIPAVAVL